MMRPTILDGGGGGGGSLIQLADHTAEAEDSGGVTVSISFHSDGRLRITEDGNNRDIAEQWYKLWDSAGIGANYDVRCESITFESGGSGFTAQGAAVGTYVQMNANRTWTVTVAAFNSHIIDAVFQIAATGDTTVLAEATLSFRAIGL